MSTSTTLVNDLAPLWLQDELLAVAEKLTVFPDIGDTPTMPEGEGITYSAQRYERLPLPGAPLSEGITPDSTPLVVNKVTAVLQQWGMVCSLTDVAMMTTKHPALQAAKDRLGNASAELQDREIQKVLMGGGTVVFPGGKTSRSTLASGDVPNTISSRASSPRSASSARRPSRVDVCRRRRPVFRDGHRRGTRPSSSSHQYAETTALMNAEIGRWRGVRWKRSNLLPILSVLATGAGGVSAAHTGLPTGETGLPPASTSR